jgi:N-acetylglucosamine kinase-like BadF-type ATPase
MFQVIDQLGLSCPIGIVNDAVPALIAGAAEGWGVALVSGTGCNCRGRDREHKREGRVTGYGFHVGEHAGASELVWRAMHAVAHDWTKRGPATTLSTVFAEYAGAKDLDDLIEGYTEGRYRVDAQAARLIFEIAGQGDVVAQELIRWAGVELGEMANAVIRQLEIEALEFDVVMSGGMFDGGSMMIEPMSETITKLAPGARMVRLAVPPVIGAVILGMEQDELVATSDIRRNLAELLKN